MKVIEYNLKRYATAQRVDNTPVLFDLYSKVVIRLNGSIKDTERYVITARKYGTEIVYKQELKGNEYELPKCLVEECKIVFNVNKIDSRGAIIQNWVLEPLQLVSVSNKENTVLESIADVGFLCERVTELSKQVEDMAKSITILQEETKQLKERLTADEEIILNPFTK